MRWTVQSERSARRFLWLLPVLMIYWAVGFYPFQWESPFYIFPNGAVLNQTGTIAFPKPGIAHTSTTPRWISQAIQSQSLQVILEINAKRTHQFGPARIFTISANTLERNLTLGQQGTDLILRLRRPDSSPNGTPAYEVKNVFSTPGWRRIDLVIGDGKLGLSINGKRRLLERLPVNLFDAWKSDYQMALGNELTFDRPWLGEIRYARVSTPDIQALYTSNKNNLSVPNAYYLARKTWSPTKISSFVSEHIKLAIWRDWAVNLVGFMPLGFLLTFLLARQYRVLGVMLLSASLSLSIELTQFFFAYRHPEIDDLFLNTLGGVLGVFVVYIFMAYRRPALA